MQSKVRSSRTLFKSLCIWEFALSKTFLQSGHLLFFFKWASIHKVQKIFWQPAQAAGDQATFKQIAHSKFGKIFQYATSWCQRDESIYTSTFMSESAILGTLLISSLIWSSSIVAQDGIPGTITYPQEFL